VQPLVNPYLGDRIAEELEQLAHHRRYSAPQRRREPQLVHNPPGAARETFLTTVNDVCRLISFPPFRIGKMGTL
jgi:hypothetical protein